MKSLIHELHRMYNANKLIPCCVVSYEAFKKLEQDYLDIRVNDTWIRYRPRTKTQRNKAMFYENYSHTYSPCVMEQWRRDKEMR